MDKIAELQAENAILRQFIERQVGTAERIARQLLKVYPQLEFAIITDIGAADYDRVLAHLTDMIAFTMGEEAPNG